MGENKKIFEELLRSTKREGIEDLIKYIQKSDFYTAPASTRFHMSCEGGLLQHSLNVYQCLSAKKSNPVWGKVLSNIPEESLIISSLLHDLCKTYFYEKGFKNQKTYDTEKVSAAEKWQVKKDDMGSFIWETVPTFTVNDKFPLGHGEKSVLLAMSYIKLTAEELFAIRWHMGFTEERSNYSMISDAMEKHPLTLALHEADLEATHLLEAEK